MGKKQRQTEILFRAHGGARRGAGRKRVAPKARVLHRPRTLLTGREPVLVTLTTQRPIANLRGRRAMERIVRSLSRAKDRLGARIVHYSVQRDHLHLIVEAEGTRSLSRAMQGLSVRITKALNRALGRKGKVFTDRFHDRALDLAQAGASRAGLRAVQRAQARRRAADPRRAGPVLGRFVLLCSVLRGLVPRGVLERRDRDRGHCSAADLAPPDRLATRGLAPSRPLSGGASRSATRPR
jgi:putative transposase